MPWHPSLKNFALAVSFVGSLGLTPVTAAQRTFVLTPADLVAAPDVFSAKVLSRSATLGRAIGLKRGAVRFAKGVCPSLLSDATRRLTRVRLLEGPTSAPLVVGRTLAMGLTDALTLMNAVTWFPPASGRTRQAHWVSEPVIAGAVGFTTAGFAIGDQTGALGKGEAGNRIPGFRMDVNLTNENDPGVGTADLIVAITTEAPAAKIGKPAKRTECILVASLLPVDVKALRDLVSAAPLIPSTRNLLTYTLSRAQTLVDRGKPDRAARSVRAFVHGVSQRSATEIPPAFAESMINRGNAAAEALSF